MGKCRTFVFPFDELTDEEKERIMNNATRPEKGENEDDKHEG